MVQQLGLCRGHNRFYPWSGTKIPQATQEKKWVGEWGRGITLKKKTRARIYDDKQAIFPPKKYIHIELL